MTHNDIYTKFMIEYDKANIASSYPSLTTYEVAELLNKAYIALITLKFTGNNQRKVPFEYDSKAIEDLRGLVTTGVVEESDNDKLSENDIVFELPTNMLYYINSTYKSYPTILINHQIADKFKQSPINIPWIKNPACLIENDAIHCFVDPMRTTTFDTERLDVTYIKAPISFNKNSLTYIKPETGEDKSTSFELSDSMVNELVNLAIVFATETVESPRLSTKSSIMTLEA